MITIPDLNRLIETCKFLPLYRNKPAYFDSVVKHWEKKAARKNASVQTKSKCEIWQSVKKGWEEFRAKSPAMYPSIYMNCAWVDPLDVEINGEFYHVVQVYEPKRTDDSSTHWGWGIDDGHGHLIQQWPQLHCEVNHKNYATVDEFLAEYPALLKELTEHPENHRNCQSSYKELYTPEMLVKWGKVDGSQSTM